MTQSDRILDHMAQVGPITPLEALDLYGCFRLGARIYDLKCSGNKIKSETVKVGQKYVSQYSLED